jgi:hypothetical protein
MVAIKDGETANGDKYRSFVCSNNEGGCDFFETKYGDLTPPGIEITEEMTAQDVEKLREERRNRGKMYSSSNPLISKSYYPPTQTEEKEKGSVDDLPF